MWLLNGLTSSFFVTSGYLSQLSYPYNPFFWDLISAVSASFLVFTLFCYLCVFPFTFPFSTFLSGIEVCRVLPLQFLEVVKSDMFKKNFSVIALEMIHHFVSVMGTDVLAVKTIYEIIKKKVTPAPSPWRNRILPEVLSQSCKRSGLSQCDRLCERHSLTGHTGIKIMKCGSYFSHFSAKDTAQSAFHCGPFFQLILKSTARRRTSIWTTMSFSTFWQLISLHRISLVSTGIVT